MSPSDIVILLIIAVAFVAAVRYLRRPGKGGCSGCGSASTCSAYANGGSCKAADRMIADAEAALGAGKRA